MVDKVAWDQGALGPVDGLLYFCTTINKPRAIWGSGVRSGCDHGARRDEGQ